MQGLEVSCAVRRFFKSLGFKGLYDVGTNITLPQVTGFVVGRVKFVRLMFIICMS